MTSSAAAVRPPQLGMFLLLTMVANVFIDAESPHYDARMVKVTLDADQSFQATMRSILKAASSKDRYGKLPAQKYVSVEGLTATTHETETGKGWHKSCSKYVEVNEENHKEQVKAVKDTGGYLKAKMGA